MLVRKQSAYIHVLKERFKRKLEVKQQFSDVNADLQNVIFIKAMKIAKFKGRS